MRILLVNTLYPPQSRGGAEKSVALLARALAEAGCQVTVLTSSDQSSDYIHQDGSVRVVRIRQRNVYQWPSDKVGPAKKAAWHLVDVYNRRMARASIEPIRHEQFDIINTNNLTGFSSALVPLLAKTFAAPIIHTVRDYSLICIRGTLFHQKRCSSQCCLSCRIATAPKRTYARFFSGAIGISEAVLAHHLQSGYFRPNIPRAVIPNIFGSAHSPRSFRLKRDLRAPRTIGFLGRISPEKGLRELCEAFLKNPRYHAARLMIGGNHGSPYATSLVRKYAGPNIQFMGEVDSSSFLSGLDALVVPSLWDEPLGRVALEAIAQGCPVLSANRGGLIDTLRNTGAGWLYSGDSPDLDLIKSIDVEVDLASYSSPALAIEHLKFFAVPALTRS